MSKKMALEWLIAANDDLQVIREINQNRTLTHIAAFHAQQSIEKTFKAVLEYNENRIPKKHDLIILHNLVSTFIILQEIDILDTLNSLYIESRYPGDLGLLPNGKPTIADAEEFYNFAKEIFEKVKKIITTESSE